MSDLTALLTSVGNDAFPSVLDALHEGDVRVVGTDMRPDAPGLYLADASAIVPPRSDGDALVDRLLELARDEGAQALLPLSTEDQAFFAARREAFEQAGLPVVTGSLDSVSAANDKLELYRRAQAANIPLPPFSEVGDLEALDRAAREVGFPDQPFVLKLAQGTGAQGVKVVHAELDPRNRMFERTNLAVGYDEVRGWLGALPEIPILQVSGFLPGAEYSVDVLADAGRTLCAVTRLRLSTHYGLALHARVVDEVDVAQVAEQTVAALGSSYVVNVQVRRDVEGTPRLMEVNPRIPGTIGLTVAAGVNMPRLALGMALGEDVQPPAPRIGTTALRHWDLHILPEDELLQ